MQTSRCGADAFYLTNMKAAEHKNVGMGCVWLESWLLDLEASLKPLLQQTGSSAPAHSTCPETWTNAYLLVPFPTHMDIPANAGQSVHAFHRLLTDLLQLLQIILHLSLLLCHSLGFQYQHRNWNYSASHWGHAVTLCGSCWKHLEDF